MRTLREQIYDIAKRLDLEQLSFHVSFPTLVDSIAIKMFREQETESADTHAVRRCLKLFHSGQFVTEDEPEVLS